MPAQGFEFPHCALERVKFAVYVDDPRVRRCAERECRITCGCEIGKNPYLRHQVLQVGDIRQVRTRAREWKGIIVEIPVGIVPRDGIVDEVLDDLRSSKRGASFGDYNSCSWSPNSQYPSGSLGSRTTQLLPQIVEGLLLPFMTELTAVGEVTPIAMAQLFVPVLLVVYGFELLPS